MRLRNYFVFVLLFLFACSDSSDDGDFPKLKGASSDLNRYLEAICKARSQCGDTVSDCHAFDQGYYCEAAFATVKLPGIDGCVEALSKATCDGVLAPECFAARKAIRDARGRYTLVQEGEACDNVRLHCDLDLHCSAAWGQCGQCEKGVGEGAPCPNYDECKVGLICSDGKCEKLKGKGADCDTNLDNCDENLACSKGKCVPIVSLGQACSSDLECSTGLCVSGKCVARPACGEAGVGEGCVYDASCKTGLICDSNSRCVTPIARGAVCSAEDDLSPQCAPGNFCSTTQGKATCAPQLKNGEACASPNLGGDVTCESHYCGSDGKCAATFSYCK